MSNMSTGVGESVVLISGISGLSPSPFVFRIFDMCGSFLAFYAAPITNTNFASRSLAMVWRACSLAWVSTLALFCGSAVDYILLLIRSSMSFMYCAILCSSALLSFDYWSLVFVLVGVVCDEV
jgi:hypothetical protein